MRLPSGLSSQLQPSSALFQYRASYHASHIASRPGSLSTQVDIARTILPPMVGPSYCRRDHVCCRLGWGPWLCRVRWSTPMMSEVAGIQLIMTCRRPLRLRLPVGATESEPLSRCRGIVLLSHQRVRTRRQQRTRELTERA